MNSPSVTSGVSSATLVVALVIAMTGMDLALWAPYANSKTSDQDVWASEGRALLIGTFDNPRSLAINEDRLIIADTGDPKIPYSGRVIELSSDNTPINLLEHISNSVSFDGHLEGISDAAMTTQGLYAILGNDAWTQSPLRGPNQLIHVLPSGEIKTLFDFQYYESMSNPDKTNVDSNASGLAIGADGTFWVTDAAGNWAAHLDGSGTVLHTYPFSSVDGEDAVPTGIDVDGQGNAYVTLFRCQSPTEGKGAILKLSPDGTQKVVYRGLSNPVDIKLDPKGSVFVLEYSHDYLPNTGRVLRLNLVDQTENPNIMVSSLTNPTSLMIDHEGNLFVTIISEVDGGRSGTGQLLMFPKK